LAFRKKIYSMLEELPQNLNDWRVEYDHNRPNQGKRCQGRTPFATLPESKNLVREKVIEA
jgi:hypothetical protein